MYGVTLKLQTFLELPLLLAKPGEAQGKTNSHESWQ